MQSHAVWYQHVDGNKPQILPLHTASSDECTFCPGTATTVQDS